MTMGRQAMLRVAAVMVVEFMACRAPVPPVPGKGGPAWIELTSPHFTIWADADPDRAREIMAKMERLRVLLAYAVFPTAPAEGRDLAIVLRNNAELRAFSATDQIRPFAVRVQLPLWQPMIVLSASSERGELEVALAHELVHAISSGVIHYQPRWFAEGMATYFQTAGLDPKLVTVEIGGSPTGAQITVDHLVPITELFEWTKPTREESRQYIIAWALFCFLINQHEAELQRYAHLLDDAGAEIEQRSDLARRTWDLAFPTLPFTAVDRALHDWLFNGKSYAVRRFRLKSGDRSTTERRLGDADVYAIRALLRHLAGRRDTQSRADVTAALAAEPTHVLARLLAAALDHREIAADEVRAIAGAHEDDWRAWMLVASAVSSGAAEAKAARARACEIAAANPALLPPPGLCPSRRADLPSP
ncbi:MAG TPA: hypothetical protein VF469_07600 [Kofleriaceae bacterium]